MRAIRRTALAILLAVSAPALALGQAPGSAPAPERARGDQVRIAMQASPTTLLEPFATVDDEIMVSSVVGSSLTSLELRDELVHIPALASSWDWNAAGTEITFHLRDAEWSDGKPVTAADVCFTYKLAADERYNSPRREYTSRIKSVEAVDPRTVKFTYPSAYYRENQLADAGIAILPEHTYGKLAPEAMRGSEPALNPVLHGPFRVVEHHANSAFVLERNEKSVSTAIPYLKRAIFVTIPDYEARLRALLADEIDVVDGVRPEDLGRILEKGGFEITDRGRRFVDFVAWNMRLPMFSDVRVRVALTQAIDRDGMNTALLSIGGKQYATQPIGTIPPLLRSAHEDRIRPLAYDPAASEKLLDAAGWTRPEAGAVRRRDGKPMHFKLLVNTETPRRMQSARMVQQDLRKIGVDVEIDGQRFDELQKRIEKRDFEGAIYGFSAALQLKQGDMWASGSKFNIAGYSNARVDALAAAMQSESDAVKIRENLKETQRLVYDEQPYTFLCWFPRFTIVRDRFKHFGASALGVTAGLEECFVPLKLQKSFEGR